MQKTSISATRGREIAPVDGLVTRARISWVRWVLVGLIVGFGGVSNGSTGGGYGVGYVYADSEEAVLSYDFEDISGTGTLGSTALDSDDSSQTVGMGFSFEFFGNLYANCRICTNGFLAFSGTNSSYTSTAIPNSTVPNDMIAG
ncbi:MAG: hypothetical protein P8J87_01430, partial [Verrucomicrobiales bacterium]|nr:hypothetical protein [Verrucomicrobiales bacterium]